jgi:phage tail-like protein
MLLSGIQHDDWQNSGFPPRRARHIVPATRQAEARGNDRTQTMTDQTSLVTRLPALSISHVADRAWCYPGETIALYTRVEARIDLVGLSVRVNVPRGFHLGQTDGELLVLNDERFVRWTIATAAAGARFDYQLRLIAAPTAEDVSLDCEAVAIAGDAVASAATTISIEAQGRYLKYLPAIYSEQDELMGRFLMLFESFWGPIEQQIDFMPYFLDPKTAPLDLLPWLATWVDLTLNPQWPEEKRRRLLQQAVWLFRKRGTRIGLHDYLAIYAGQSPQIVEHRANDFRLGIGARLGPSIALGKLNQPHTFSVTLRLPPVDAHSEAERRRTIEAIIESEKPAHTQYTLTIEPA